jgi:hypothetical protein
LKKVHLPAPILAFLLVSFNYASAGCSYLPGGFSVTGNYTYDTTSSTYQFVEGDTLLVTYNGTGMGTGYLEDYYFDGVFIGSRVDTFKVIGSGTFQVQQGCLSSVDYSFDCKFAVSLANTIREPVIENVSMRISSAGENNSLNLVLESGLLKNYRIEVYNLTGQKICERQNLLSGEVYSFNCISQSINIIRITDSEGPVFTKKVFAK